MILCVWQGREYAAHERFVTLPAIEPAASLLSLLPLLNRRACVVLCARQAREHAAHDRRVTLPALEPTSPLLSPLPLLSRRVCDPLCVAGWRTCSTWKLRDFASHRTRGSTTVAALSAESPRV